MNTCKNCRYFRDYGNGTGECRFNAPLPILVGGVWLKQFVHVQQEDWCGQFKQVLSPMTSQDMNIIVPEKTDKKINE